MADSENEESDWGLVGVNVLTAGFHTFIVAYITVNLIWLASINPSTLEKLLPVLDDSYPKEVPPKGNTGLTRDERVQARKKVSCDDTLRYFDDVDFSSSFACANKSVKRVNKVGCIPYVWRGEGAGQIPFALIDEILSGSTAKIEFTGPKGMLGFMAYNTYAQYRKMMQQILTGNGYLRRDSIGGPVQPILAIICFFLALIVSKPLSIFLPIFWLLILFSDLPLGYDAEKTRSFQQLAFSFWWVVLFGIVVVIPMCFWNMFYQFWTILIWASLVAPIVYANPGELVSIFLCHKEFFAVLFIGLCAFYCQDALAPSTGAGLFVCWALSALYYVSTLL